MEGASDEANSDLEESLKRFHYLFYVTLRHVKYQSPLKDIFLSTGLDRLATKRKMFELILANKSENVLILLDGFDEYPFSLDYQGLFHSTIVMTTRPWKFDVLRSRDNNFKVDAVSEAYNKQYPDMGLTSSNEEEQTEIYMGDNSSAKWSSSIRIPLFLIITVLIWLENNKSLSKSLTCNILGLLKVIFQRGNNKLSQTDKQALKRAEQEKKGPSVFHEDLTAKYKFRCDNQVLLQHLGRLAYKGLTDQKGLSLVFTKDELHEFLDLEELEICYKLSLLTGSTVTTSLLDPPQVSISFYHKLMQELFAAIGIISDSDNTLSEFTTILKSLRAVLEMENVILFITALNPCIGSYLSKHIAGLVETDDKVCEYRREVYTSYKSNILKKYSKLTFKCMFEWDSVHDRKEQKCLYLTDLIIDSDFDRKLRLCTYHNMEHLKFLNVKVPSYESDNIKQILSQLTTLTSEATSLQFLYITTESEWYEGIQTMDIDLNKNEHLEGVLIRIPLSHGQHFGLMFSKTVRLRTINIQNAIINNTIYLQNINKLKLENVKLREIGLPTRLEELEHVSLQSVTMPGLSWNSFFQTLQTLQSPSLTQLILKNPNIDDITINLENSSGLWGIELEDVKLREIRLPTRLEGLKYVKLLSVTMPGPSWNSFFQSLQSPSLTGLILKNLNIDDITINLENSPRQWAIGLEDVKLREIRLPTRLEELYHVSLLSVTMPVSSWNSFFQTLQSLSLTKLILKNPNIDDITINLENSSGLQELGLEDMKLREIRLPTRLEKLEYVSLQSVTMPGSSWNSFFQTLQSPSLTGLLLKNPNIDDITINLVNISGLEELQLEDVKLREIRLTTRLEELEYVSLLSVTMPGSSWNSFFQTLQSLSLIQLILKNPNIDDITINLENSSGLQKLELEDVKLREIRLPTRLEELKYVTYQSVTMPGSSWNSFFQTLQSPSLTGLILKNLNINKIRLHNCKRLKCLGISSMKLAEIDISGIESPVKIEADEFVLPESQANSFFNQVLLSTELRQLTMKNICLGGDTVQFDRWNPPLKYNPLLDDGRWLNIKIRLENVTMSQESYECLCILLKRLKFSENQVTNLSIDTGSLNVTVFCEIEITPYSIDKELLP